MVYIKSGLKFENCEERENGHLATTGLIALVPGTDFQAFSSRGENRLRSNLTSPQACMLKSCIWRALLPLYVPAIQPYSHKAISCSNRKWGSPNMAPQFANPQVRAHLSNSFPLPYLSCRFDLRNAWNGRWRQTETHSRLLARLQRAQGMKCPVGHTWDFQVRAVPIEYMLTIIKAATHSSQVQVQAK